MAGTQIGLSDLHYSLLTSDTVSSVTYEAPVSIPGIIMANINPNSSSGVLYKDDGPGETYSSMGEVTVEIEVSDIPLEVQAVLLGHTITSGILKRKSTDVSPYIALGFKSLKSNGSYRYVWLYKGKFQLPEINHQTKNDKVNFQIPKMKASFIRLDYDNSWIKQADEDHEDYVSSIGTNWFTAVEGEADTSAPTVTSVPADSATGVAVDANIVLTFSEAIQASTAIVDNFFIVKADGTDVPFALTINDAHTIVTLNPSSNLASSGVYIAGVTKGGVKDIAGNAIASANVINFTTA